MPKKIDVKKLRREAEDEIQTAYIAAAKKQIASKLVQIRQAKEVVRNLERELSDLELEIAEDQGA